MYVSPCYYQSSFFSECEIQINLCFSLQGWLSLWWVSTLMQSHLSRDSCRSATIFIPHIQTQKILYLKYVSSQGSLLSNYDKQTSWNGLSNSVSHTVSLFHTHILILSLAFTLSVTKPLCGLNEVTHRAQVSFHYTINTQPISILSWHLWGQWAVSTHNICTSEMEGIEVGGCVCFCVFVKGWD